MVYTNYIPYTIFLSKTKLLRVLGAKIKAMIADGYYGLLSCDAAINFLPTKPLLYKIN